MRSVSRSPFPCLTLTRRPRQWPAVPPSAAVLLSSSRSFSVVALSDFQKEGVFCLRLGWGVFLLFFFAFFLRGVVFFLIFVAGFQVLCCGCFPLFLGFCRCRLGRLRLPAVSVRGVRGLLPRWWGIPPFVARGCGLPRLRWCLGRPRPLFLVCRLVGCFAGRVFVGCGGSVWRRCCSWRPAVFVFLIFFNFCSWCGSDAADL